MLAETPCKWDDAVKEVPWQCAVLCCCPVLVKSQDFLGFFSNFCFRCHSLLHKEDKTVIFLTILVKNVWCIVGKAESCIGKSLSLAGEDAGAGPRRGEPLL